MVAALFLWGLLARPGEDFLRAGSAAEAGKSGMRREKWSKKWGQSLGQCYVPVCAKKVRSPAEKGP